MEQTHNPATNAFAFVMAGGSGERFWPMSRTATPKHLLKLLGERTLLEETVRRLEGLVPPEHIHVLTSAAQLGAVRSGLPLLPPENIVAEPAKRDTAPACALATALARSKGGDSALCALLPADAMIHDATAFRSQLAAAFTTAASEKAIVTFAVPPTHPSTAFGYLHLEDEGPAEEPLRVRRFVEKPDLATARSYLDQGCYGWNAGIFVWQASVFLDACSAHAPDLEDFVKNFPEGNFASYLETRFPGLKKISVDYAILEKARDVRAIRAAFDWDDVGSWTAMPHHLPQDDAGNTIRGNAVAHNARNNIVATQGRLVALCGVENLVVIETPDAILVCHRDAAQDIKSLQTKIPDNLK
jgi:mannose-1-phosphate guanylyltransferase